MKRKPPGEKACAQCGNPFQPFLTTDQFCSMICGTRWADALRDKRLAKNIDIPLAEAKQRWKGAKRDRCENCGSRHGLTQHHVVREQDVEKRGGDLLDPRNSLTLCWDCHGGQHHTRSGRLPLSCLRAESIAFGEELLGEAAADYWPRYYEVP